MDSSTSDSSGFWTLPRNFRLRTIDSDMDEDIQETTTLMEGKNEANIKTRDSITGPVMARKRSKLFRQHTISNPGYDVVVRNVLSHQQPNSSCEIPTILPRQSYTYHTGEK